MKGRDNMINRTKMFCGGDNFLLKKEDTYYIYCTTENSLPAFTEEYPFFETYNEDGSDGIMVHTTKDLVHWEKPILCLDRDRVLGSHGFWAPEVSYYKGKYYMVYAADEKLAIAVADEPTGPFLPHTDSYLLDFPTIDGHLLFDTDGRIYLYYAAITGGNTIRVAEMEPDLKRIRKNYSHILIAAEEPWETVDCTVAEGPFVIKHKGLYYLSYSANHTRSPEYAVGYAVSDCPTGPFRKYAGNPILHRPNGVFGTGHHSFAPTEDENRFLMVYHCHPGTGYFKPRMACITEAAFVEEPDGFDILTVLGK